MKREEKLNDYENFVEKFKPKKTTDDCYTPPCVYEAVLSWVKNNADIAGREIVRPFYPGGDYEHYNYPARCVVVDNPPFSIFSQILRFYLSKGIAFFLFGPHLTLFKPIDGLSYIITGASVRYENGAIVSTSFVTNLPSFATYGIIGSPELKERIEEAQKEAKGENKLTFSDLERECQDQLVEMGHKAIFCDESKRKKGQQLPALDMIMDDSLMDIRSVTGRGWYSNIFVVKNDQLRRFNQRKDIQPQADSLCLYFHDSSLFDEDKMRRSINYFKFYRDQSGELIKRDLKYVYCVVKGRTKIIKYEIA